MGNSTLLGMATGSGPADGAHPTAGYLDLSGTFHASEADAMEASGRILMRDIAINVGLDNSKITVDEVVEIMCRSRETFGRAFDMLRNSESMRPQASVAPSSRDRGY